ncbi:LysR substrate-binding domain-containing protein [Sulfitobacter sp. JB4-11]|uniref:LysR substrate-binding domain-containing protein n=1 Tax=Sulfitobacter rhodophyticola TaxID=3238304 RepID=UPI003D81A7F8
MHKSKMPLPLPPLNALRAFEAAGRHQSFSRAAEELRVSHSSISRHVRGLEDRLGVQLFRLQSRGLALTREGAAYLAEISPALEAIAQATDDMAEVPEGVVWINSEPLFAAKWLIPRLSDFYTKHPEVEVRIEASKRLADVDRYEADLALRFVHPGGKYPLSELISDAPLYPFASPGLLAAPAEDPRDLLTFPLLRDRGSDSWTRWCKAAGIPEEDAPTFNWYMRSPMAYEAALAGQAIILISGEVVDNDAQAGRLTQVSDVGFRSGGFYLVRSEGAMRRKAVRVFRDWLLEESAPWRSAG